jgi:hypothetical protein
VPIPCPTVVVTDGRGSFRRDPCTIPQEPLPIQASPPLKRGKYSDS